MSHPHSIQGETRRSRVLSYCVALALAVAALVSFNAPPAQADGLMSVDQYVAQTQGRVVGNGQCAITVEDFLAKVYDVHVNLAGVPGYGAYGFAPGWSGGAQMQSAGFTWSASNTDLQNGDVLVWSGGYGGLGHVGIWYQGKVYDSNSLYRGRTTTSGAPVGSSMAAALEGYGTQFMMNNTGGDGHRYSGRWRKTPPIHDAAGTAPNPVGSAAPAHTFPTLAAANIRQGASTATSRVNTVGRGAQLTIDCYVLGQVVGGTAIWDRVPSMNGFISDSLLLTGSNSAVVPLCPSGGSSGQLTWAGAGIYRLSTDYQAASYGLGITTLAKNSQINIDCWVLGKGMPARASNGSAYTDYVWYHVPSYPGWVSDAKVQTTSDNATVGQFGPQCGLGTIQGPFPVIGSTAVYGSPSTDAPPVTSVGGGSKVSIDCTTTGNSVHNASTGQTSTLWNHVNGLGYIPDVYVLTGVNSEVAPPCVVASPSPDAPVVSGTTPTIEGASKVGSTLQARVAGWSTPGVTFRYNWTVSGSDAVLGTEPSLQVPASAAGREVTLTVTGDAPRFEPTSMVTQTVGVVGKGVFKVVKRPTISGVTRTGHLLRASAGQLSPAPTTVQYQWCANGHAIPGAHHRALRVARAYAGKRLSVRVTATRAGYRSAHLTALTQRPTGTAGARASVEIRSAFRLH